MMNGSGLRQATITDMTKKLFLKLSAPAWLLHRKVSHPERLLAAVAES